MSEAYEEVLDVIDEHQQDGFLVPAVRVDEDTMEGLLSDESYIPANAPDLDLNLSEEADGKIAGTEIIVDDSISEPVADDVELMDL